MTFLPSENAMVSVIIPCYNHSHYLSKAIESVLTQNYSPLEIIVIDDGSSDDTKQVAQSFSGVTYIYQNNQGLSASRNAGILKSSGEYIILLDADDWLYPNAIQTNLDYLQQNKNAAFVSGSYDGIYENENFIMDVTYNIEEEHYTNLLKGNFIGVPACVMYRRHIFDEFLFDTTLRACEDYDLYLKVSRKYPVIHHTEKIAAYRKHSANMSSNFSGMLLSALSVLRRQKNNLKSKLEVEAYKEGKRFWKTYYTKKIYKKFLTTKDKIRNNDLLFLLKNNGYLFLKFLIAYPVNKLFRRKK